MVNLGKLFKKLIPVFMAVGFMMTLFLVIDIAFVFWAAIQAGGTVTVGDTMEILLIEFFIVLPMSLMFLTYLIFRKRGRF